MLYVDPESGSLLSDDSCEIVSRVHNRILNEWLSLSLTEQYEELEAYLSGLGPGGRQTFLRLLSYPECWTLLAPPNAPDEIRELFWSDLGALIKTISTRTGDGTGDVAFAETNRAVDTVQQNPASMHGSANWKERPTLPAATEPTGWTSTILRIVGCKPICH
jgi:hypothetical protein